MAGKGKFWGCGVFFWIASSHAPRNDGLKNFCDFAVFVFKKMDPRLRGDDGEECGDDGEGVRMTRKG